MNEIYFGTLEQEFVTQNIAKEISLNPEILKGKYNGDNIRERAVNAIKFLDAMNVQYDNSVIAVVTHGSLMESIYNFHKYGSVAGIWRANGPKSMTDEPDSPLWMANLAVFDYTAFKYNPNNPPAQYLKL